MGRCAFFGGGLFWCRGGGGGGCRFCGLRGGGLAGRGAGGGLAGEEGIEVGGHGQKRGDVEHQLHLIGRDGGSFGDHVPGAAGGTGTDRHPARSSIFFGKWGGGK